MLGPNHECQQYLIISWSLRLQKKISRNQFFNKKLSEGNQEIHEEREKEGGAPLS